MPTDFAAHIADLRNLGGQRVWSLMISLFGDLAQAEGDMIDGPVLSAIMNTLQVKPEAVRVALHRLRNDGWIVSQKSGRISRHSLTEKGRSESAAASPRIYAGPASHSEDWQVVLMHDTPADTLAEMEKRGFVPLFPQVFLGPASATAPADAMVLTGDTVPAWVRDQAAPNNLRDSYAALHHSLSELSGALPPAHDLSAVEIAVLRCLIVHNWRRLVLKHPPLPRALVSDDWPGHHCRLLVVDLLDRFPRPELTKIELHQAA